MIQKLVFTVFTAISSMAPLNAPSGLSTESREINTQMEDLFDSIHSIQIIQKKLKAKISHLQKEKSPSAGHLEKLSGMQKEMEQQKAVLTDRLEQLAERHMEIWEELNLPEMDPAAGKADADSLIREDHPGWMQENLPASSGSVSGGLLGQGFACEAAVPERFSSSSKSLMIPVQGYRSAGTWAYPAGGMHLGLDLASPLYTPVKAPADGIILYAGTPSPSNGGYLGNYAGWPAGGGNTIAMLCQTEDKLYAVTFAHLSSQFYVKPGMQVLQGTVLALSGNSGNSTGPHTHIEVFEMKVSMAEAMACFGQNADFSFGCGWSSAGSCSAVACRIRPEAVFH
ncbi:MAG: peptidoglycan DD-metalloendopeptidase family protein [Erysipelotrichaceae bacterium]|nr:peptidoglycan DD-metalloendopeptidase family protein [Erysipelotrichaceae bacterium]